MFICCLRIDVTKANSGSSFAMNNLTKTCLTLDNAVWNSEFAANCRQANDNFQWFNVMCNCDDAGFLVLNELHDFFDAKTNGRWAFCDLLFLAFNAIVSTLAQTLFLCLTSLGTVFVQEFEQIVCYKTRYI